MAEDTGDQAEESLALCPEKRIKLAEEDEENDLLKGTLTEPEHMSSSKSPDGKHKKTVEAPALPEDWVVAKHSSNINVYFHMPTRTCTMSRPYTIPQNTRVNKHKIPVDAIPCLKQWLFEDNKSPLATEWHTAAGNRLGQLARLEPERVDEYVKRRWPQGMAPLNSKGYEVTSSHHEHRPRKVPKKKDTPVNKPAVPENISKTVEIRVPKRYRIANINGKISPSLWKVNTLLGAVSLLYDFCEHYLRADIDFLSQETEDSVSPYLCTVIIGGTKYGSGRGTSKKTAKRTAADSTLQLFLPDFHMHLNSVSKPDSQEKFQFLSNLHVSDPKSADILSQAGLPSPWQMLRECIQRNKGSDHIGEPEFDIELRPVDKNQGLSSASDPTLDSTSDPIPTMSAAMEINNDHTPINDQTASKDHSTEEIIANNSSTSKTNQYQSFYHLKCGEKLSVSGPCPGRKVGQQLSAQAMLKLIHPYMDTWEPLVRIYGDDTTNCPRVIAEKEPNNMLFLSQSENSVLLDELRKEMRKLPSEK